jgi:hypothetical protein
VRILALLAITAALWLARGAAASGADALDDALYRALLQAYTRAVPDTAGTRVDYRGLGAEPRWRELVAGLGRSRPAELRTREERLAFWIDAYNVLAIDLVVRHYPVSSIRDLGSLFRPVWRAPAGSVGGRSVTLHEIEHETLRPMGEPRIHAAIVCASTSCPSLAREPFSPPRIDAQLDAALRAFLADPRKGLRVERASRRVTLSPIFDWFEADFAAGGGVLATLEPYLPEAERAWWAANRGALEIDYFDYDWRLNDLAAAGGGG